jgi:hypothetical protein
MKCLHNVGFRVVASLPPAPAQTLSSAHCSHSHCLCFARTDCTPVQNYGKICQYLYFASSPLNTIEGSSGPNGIKAFRDLNLFTVSS